MDHLTKFNRPSNGTILGFLALFISLGGVAYATTNLVAVQDPVTGSRARVVEGRLRVDPGVLDTQLAEPAAFYHRTTFNLVSGSGCVVVAAPPTGKALVVRQARVNVFDNPSPGVANNVLLYMGTSGCNSFMGDVNPPTVGQFLVPFDPGLGIPKGHALYAYLGGNLSAEIFIDGFTVPAASVPVPPADEMVAAGASRNGPGANRPRR